MEVEIKWIYDRMEFEFYENENVFSLTRHAWNISTLSRLGILTILVSNILESKSISQ